MRQIIYLLVIMLLFSFGKKEKMSVSKEITIAGKVINYDINSGKNILTIYINDNGRATQLNYATKLDSSGNFKVKFERYYPQDVMISYKTNIKVIVHPGDSLYVEFNGNTDQRTEIFETVKYSGDAATINTLLSKYLKTYFETRPSSKLIRKNEKLLDAGNYKKFQDSIRQENEIRKDLFLQSNKANKELVSWINSSIQLSYYEQLLDYPDNHKRYNNLPKEWKVDEKFFDFVDTIPSLKLNDLIYADSRWFINRFLYDYIWEIAWNKADSKSNSDSLIFHQILELSPKEGLVKQLALNEFINAGLSRYETSFYEKNESLINASIHENFLIEPIHEYYAEIKTLLQKPVLATDIEINGINDKSASDLWKKILEENKGKVIYVDCWATWCGACIAEFPNSNKMMEEYKEKDVVFVYLCLKSKEQLWKTILADKKLKGKHYFLNDEQSSYFENILRINGYPTYAIINKQGQIIRTGNNFRPSHENTEKVINELL